MACNGITVRRIWSKDVRVLTPASVQVDCFKVAWSPTKMSHYGVVVGVRKQRNAGWAIVLPVSRSYEERLDYSWPLGSRNCEPYRQWHICVTLGFHLEVGENCSLLGHHIVVVQRLRWSRGSVLAFDTQVRGFKPGRSSRIFQGKKSSARLPSEGK